MAAKRALVIIASGTEEMEAVIVANVMRRAGINVSVASVSDEGSAAPVTCARKVNIVPDLSLKEALTTAKYDAVVLPGGGEGAKNLGKSDLVKQALQEQEKAGRIIAAICAAPTALSVHGIALGKTITSYPSFKDQLADAYKYSEDLVVKDGNIITSRGPGTCFAFALALVESLVGKEMADDISKAMLC